MPGMENFAPERTLSSSGSAASPSFLPMRLLQLGERLPDLLVDFLRDLVVVVEEDVADVGRDREARRNRHTGAAHLRQAGAFAAQDVLHRSVAVGRAAAEHIDVLLALLRFSYELVLRRFRRNPRWSKTRPAGCSTGSAGCAGRARRAAFTSTLSKNRSTLGRSAAMLAAPRNRLSPADRAMRLAWRTRSRFGTRFEQCRIDRRRAGELGLPQNVLDAFETRGQRFEVLGAAARVGQRSSRASTIHQVVPACRRRR